MISGKNQSKNKVLFSYLLHSAIAITRNKFLLEGVFILFISTGSAAGKFNHCRRKKNLKMACSESEIQMFNSPTYLCHTSFAL